ncbi:MAG: hypothetical protein EBW73_11480, partial [Betaproteobacteria bacterium]|nr:hypothetical protein [Betaproteobacteria bacterium]
AQRQPLATRSIFDKGSLNALKLSSITRISGSGYRGLGVQPAPLSNLVSAVIAVSGLVLLSVCISFLYG